VDIDEEATVDDDGPVQLVPGYQVVGFLGRGGMGTVLLADGPDGRQALKILPTAGLRQSARQRFEREARLLGEIRHPHVVRLGAHGATEQVHWLTMEWIQGPSLASVLSWEEPLPVEELVRILHAIALAVNAVHDAGLAHRDIKPSNILLRPTGEPILADFGLTRVMDPTDHTPITRRPVGTPRYMAPELLRAEEVDWVAVDVFALGAVLAKGLTGRVPAGGWELKGNDPLIALARQSMAERPLDRPRSAGEFAAGLQARPAWVRPRMIGAAVGALALSIALVIGYWSTRPEPVRVDLDPLRQLVAERRHDDAYDLVTSRTRESDGPTADAWWLGWSEVEGTSVAAATAWERVSWDARLDALGLLARALAEEARYDQLDVLLAGAESVDALDPDGALRRDNDVFHRRFEGLVAGPLAGQVHELFGKATLLTPDNAPLWICSSGRCFKKGEEPVLRPRGTRIVRAGERTYLWANGEVRSLDDASSCPIDTQKVPFQSSGVGTTLFLAHTGARAGLTLLDMDTCTERQVEDQEEWAGSYVTLTVPWDADGDGQLEVAVAVGEPFSYALHVYELDGRRIARRVIGSLKDAQPLGDRLVVNVQRPHGNGHLFGIEEPGLFVLKMRDETLEISSRVEGAVHSVVGLDLGEGVAGGVGHDEVLRLDLGDEGPVRIGGVRNLRYRQVGGERRLILQRGHDRYLLGADDGTDVLRQAPVQPVQLTGDRDIDRARALARLGFASLGAAGLEARLLGRRDSKAGPLWAEAGRSWELDGELGKAVVAWRTAGELGVDGARARALDLAVQDGDLAAAAALRDGPGPWDEVLQSTLSFDFTSAPAISMRDPWARWLADDAALTFVSSGGAGVLAELPLDRTSSTAGFRARLRIEQLEWGTEWVVGIGSNDDDLELDVLLAVRGSQGSMHRIASPLRYPAAKEPVVGPFERREFEVVAALTGNEARWTVRGTDGVERRYTTTVDPGAAPRFRVRVDGLPGAFGTLALSELTLWGFEASSREANVSADAVGPDQLTELRRTPTVAPLVAGDQVYADQLLAAYGSGWGMHGSRSGLAERILALPGLGQPDVWRAHPELALLRADVAMARGEARQALDILQTLGDRGNCVGRTSLLEAAAFALGEAAAAEAAGRALEACTPNQGRVRSARWAMGMGEAGRPTSGDDRRP
jgi:hypothetical protein